MSNSLFTNNDGSSHSSSSTQDPQMESFPLSRNMYRNCFKTMGANKAAELLRYGKSKPDCISLAQGEGTLPTPDFICGATNKALSEGKTFYSFGAGLPELRQEIATYYSRIYNVQIPTNRITVTSSGTNAVHYALLSILEEGDEVVAVTPIWKNLIGITELAGGHIVEFPMMQGERGWTLDLDQLFASCSSSTKALLIVTPNNPTGWTMSAQDIKRVTEFARERGIWIIADEVYGRCVHNDVRAPSFLDYSGDDDRLYVINSFSKSWAMTGWRLGWLIGPADAEDKIRDLILYENMGPPTFNQYGGIEALRHGEDFIKSQKEMWVQNLDQVMAHMDRLSGLKMVRPDSAFYAFFKVEGCKNSYDLTKQLIDEVGLSLSPGAAFGNGFQDYLRMCFAVCPDTLAESLDRLEKFIKKA
ncbi:MAG: aminotransferase class I/II-fold pyridoxal phosphate-dependent enzyme [Alphaproteobacteria bacterium]|nr:aminotransferase class I/II-fold pyridoxal phosphate-dependent enzyme [Alphaproteobacteria bacterium]MCB1550585.1 aminotransferase class I/II-fold pyridoxal phosphate-dependent enzyme [Alphaproteobacteria bacterium]MCB9985450.1 aminotransferase class I/II-fold pyridoxal phosphate-dependent enzyme [Micavibrio sp.]HPQ50313.1 aminotransferase class I/II-fold pyridoxal phosphate-dependent enzyme [Alphaproteobacteria bacterium]HRK98537.1 aminotransferase class I/II-fold pyridoxal phosphate-depend